MELADNLNLSFGYSLDTFEKVLKKSLNGDAEQKLRVKLKIKDENLEIASVVSEIIRPHTFQHYPPIQLAIYPHYRKPLDGHSLWKYENPSIYVDSMNFAREQDASQAILLNEYDDIVETSLSNFYYISDNKVYTPPLHSGAVNGVFRRYLKTKIEIEEQILNINEIHRITECFITSAIRGIIGVSKINSRCYPTHQVEQIAKELYKKLEF